MDTYFDMLPSELILIIMFYLRGESIRISYIGSIYNGLYKSFINNIMKGFYDLETIFTSSNIDTYQFDLIFNSIKDSRKDREYYYPLKDTKGVIINRELLINTLYNISDEEVYCNCAYTRSWYIPSFFIVYTDGSKYYYLEKFQGKIKHTRFDTSRELFMFLPSEALNFMLMQQGYKVESIKDILPRVTSINGISRNKWMKENKWELYPKFRYINFNKK